MIFVVVILGVLIGVLGLALWVVWRSKGTMPTGQPTPDEARISNMADQQAKEVEHADRKTLFGLARSRINRLRK